MGCALFFTILKASVLGVSRYSLAKQEMEL